MYDLDAYEKYCDMGIVNDRVLLAARLMDIVYSYSLVGGNLHIILDDCNILDSHLEFCLREVFYNHHELPLVGNLVELELLRLLNEMTVEERACAIKLYETGYPQDETI